MAEESTCNAGDLGLIPESKKGIEKGMAAEFHGQRSLAGYSSWDRKESEMTEQLTLSSSLFLYIIKDKRYL